MVIYDDRIQVFTHCRRNMIYHTENKLYNEFYLF